MKPIDPAKMRFAEAKARKVANIIDAEVNGNLTKGDRYGFVALVFSFEGPELSYVSNAQRPDMVKALEELLGRWKRREMSDFPGGIDARN